MNGILANITRVSSKLKMNITQKTNKAVENSAKSAYAKAAKRLTSSLNKSASCIKVDIDDVIIGDYFDQGDNNQPGQGNARIGDQFNRQIGEDFGNPNMVNKLMSDKSFSYLKPSGQVFSTLAPKRENKANYFQDFPESKKNANKKIGVSRNKFTDSYQTPLERLRKRALSKSKISKNWTDWVLNKQFLTKPETDTNENSRKKKKHFKKAELKLQDVYSLKTEETKPEDNSPRQAKRLPCKNKKLKQSVSSKECSIFGNRKHEFLPKSEIKQTVTDKGQDDFKIVFKPLEKYEDDNAKARYQAHKREIEDLLECIAKS